MASDSPFQTLDFSVEGRMALQDVAFALKEGILSSSLPCSQQIAYLNLTTQEGDRFCVELTSSGFKVVGKDYDSIDTQDGPTFETVYSLLQSVSSSFCQQFSAQLSDKLLQIQKDTQQQNSS